MLLFRIKLLLNSLIKFAFKQFNAFCLIDLNFLFNINFLTVLFFILIFNNNCFYLYSYKIGLEDPVNSLQ